MTKTTKAWLTAAAVLTITGLLLFAAGMTVHGWDFSRLDTAEYETKHFVIVEPFSGISADIGDADLILAPAEDGTCGVLCRTQKGTSCIAEVRDHTLYVTRSDSRAWYDAIQIAVNEPQITLFLPQNEYESLTVRGTSADVEIPNGFSFRNADVAVTTGDIRVMGVTAETAELSVTTGKVSVTDTDCVGTLAIHVTTGGTELRGVTCGDLVSDGSTGDAVLDNVKASGRITVERSTGDVSLISSDAAEIAVTTGTGNVTGSLLSEKTYITHSGTGGVDVPASQSGGRCTVTTGTGNIRFQ